jgi:hypothetical protein
MSPSMCAISTTTRYLSVISYHCISSATVQDNL